MAENMKASTLVDENGNVVEVVDAEARAGHFDFEDKAPTTGEELITEGKWTSAGWSGNFADGFSHTSGNTTPLCFALPDNRQVAKKWYRIEFKTDVSMTETNLRVRIGNSELFELYGLGLPASDTIILGLYAPEEEPLEFVPDNTFTGRIYDISLKEITGISEPNFVFTAPDGSRALEMRVTNDPRNPSYFFGSESGERNLYNGVGENIGVGVAALKNNTTGFWNIAFCGDALRENTVGSRNIALGHVALANNTTGHRNIALGTFALTHNTNGYHNLAIGADCLDHNTSGYKNVAIGFAAMYTGTTGYQNTTIGTHALNRVTNGFQNTAIGTNALYNQTWHQQNVGVGYQAGFGCKGSYNVCLGAMAGFNEFTGNRNILIGYNVNASSASAANELNIGNLIKGSMGSGNKYAEIDGGLQINALPTTDPAIAGRLWNDNGTVKVSAGEA